MRTLKITSPSNPMIREALRIREKRGKYRNAAFLVEGPHLMDMAISSPYTGIKRVFFTEAFRGREEGRQLLGRVAQKGDAGSSGRGEREVFLLEIPEPLLSRIAGTETPQGIVAIVSYPVTALGDIAFRDVPFLVVCDGIQDPGNLGTIIRVADAAGADGVVILPGSCDVFMPKTVRATAGSLFSLPIAYSSPDALADYFEVSGIMLAVADVRAEVPVYAFDFARPVAVAFGNEAHGPGRELRERAKGLVKIPIIGKAESLNVAMSATVCLYEAVRQRWFSGGRGAED
ncbi:MAG: RNA methyltransferase [Alphaproteobacteria bacterium]|uniref:RNA methyltransferase n=1 Tax=Candidatus Nitrobium versatile TaxID=2884831 RepID=A0A953JD06_9BACT|nr:RNA methyltransferase [Candidatus Nitrobium versatile]